MRIFAVTLLVIPPDGAYQANVPRHTHGFAFKHRVGTLIVG